MRYKILVFLLFYSLIGPLYASDQITQVEISTQNVQENKMSGPLYASDQITQVEISTQSVQENKMSIFGALDFGSLYASANGYKSLECSVPISLTICAEYDLMEFEKIKCGVGIRYSLPKEIVDFKTKFSLIPIYGFGRWDLGNIFVTGRLGYGLPKMETTATGKWEGDFCCGIGVGFLYDQNIKFACEYSMGKAKYTFEDFVMNWDYNILSLIIKYQL